MSDQSHMAIVFNANPTAVLWFQWIITWLVQLGGYDADGYWCWGRWIQLIITARLSHRTDVHRVTSVINQTPIIDDSSSPATDNESIAHCTRTRDQHVVTWPQVLAPSVDHERCGEVVKVPCRALGVAPPQYVATLLWSRVAVSLAGYKQLQFVSSELTMTYVLI